MDDSFFKAVNESIDGWTDQHVPQRPQFGGKAGEAVPVVSTEDLKAVWNYGEESAKRHGAGEVATSSRVFQALCKPGANVHAVVYRGMMLGLMLNMRPDLRDMASMDTLFRAVANVSMQWTGEGVRQGLPISEHEFFRLLQE